MDTNHALFSEVGRNKRSALRRPNYAATICFAFDRRAIQAPPAEICSCNFGIPAIHGGQKLLLHFRHTGEPESAASLSTVVPSRHLPEIAPAFPAYRPSMAIKKGTARIIFR